MSDKEKQDKTELEQTEDLGKADMDAEQKNVEITAENDEQNEQVKEAEAQMPQEEVNIVNEKAHDPPAEDAPNIANENANNQENEPTDNTEGETGQAEDDVNAQESEETNADGNDVTNVSQSREGTPPTQQPKPPTPTETEAGTLDKPESETAIPAESNLTPAGSKPATPTAAGSQQAAPTPAGSKPVTPTPAGSKPVTPTPAGSKPVTPTPAGSKPVTPTPPGTKSGTPVGSKAPSPTPAGSRPPTSAGSKPATPQPDETNPADPKAPTPTQGSKPPTPTAAGSKPPTPAGSKKATPAGSKEASRAGTPQETPGSANGSSPPSRKNTPEKDTEATAETTSVAPPSVPPPPPAPAPVKKVERNESLQENQVSDRALNIIWSFGLNKNVPVLNLTDGSRTAVMYVCAHTGVLYDYRNNSQTLLQGHGNAISCTCVSADKRWVATADQGNDTLIIVWDTFTGTPVRTIFEAHPRGTAAVAMTPDAKYLASLSSTMPQTLALWDWTVEGEVPICSTELDPSFGLQNYIYFNPEDVTQLVTNSESQVIFYSWKGENVSWQAPPLSDDDFNKSVGKFSQSIFLEGSARALTATSLGNLVVWESSNKKKHERKALKLVKLQDKGLNVLTVTEKYIVTGDLQGQVKFFDQTLKLVNWYQDLQVGPINAISFAHDPKFSSSETEDKDYPSDATIHAQPISYQDFVIGTTDAIYAHITTDGTDIEIIHRDHDAPVPALVSHPKRSFIAVGGHSGLLQIWDYEQRETVVIRRFNAQISCCGYDPEGQFLAVGFTDGSLRVLDSLSLDDTIADAFCYARDTITHAVFSHDSQYLATADAEYTVSLYKACYEIGEERWQYVGRYKSHYKFIQDILFTTHLDSNQPRLLSLGQDRVLVEYDLENSFKDNLKVISLDRIEQSAEPQCMAMYPAVTKESFIVTANDQFKFKLYNSTTKMCRKTLLSPTYGSPVKKIVVLPMSADGRGHLAYITDDKVGLNMLPLDGNPHNAMALIAHPQGVANLVSSCDGRYLFTAGGVDCTVHMWAINHDALAAQSQLGGQDLIPFYGLLDGGRDGDLFKELEDYFYYAQLRSQGVNAHGERDASITIPVSEIPFVMRAMGFYPSEQEVEDMLNEVKYSTYIDTGSYKTEIDLGDFIKLYTNHRPAFGLQPNKFAWAFDVLGFDTMNGPAVDRGDLLNLLQTAGEAMTEYELAEYLTTLLGYNEEGGQSEEQEFDADQAGDIIDQNLPHDITAEMFTNDLLGFDMYLDYGPSPNAPSRSAKSSQMTGAVQ